MASVLVTGCSSGVGLATALAFGRRGDRTFAGVRRPQAADELEAAIDASRCRRAADAAQMRRTWPRSVRRRAWPPRPSWPPPSIPSASDLP